MEGMNKTNKIQKEAYDRKVFLETPEDILNEAHNQFISIYWMIKKPFDEIKNSIPGFNLISFEDYTINNHPDDGLQIISEVEETNPDVFIKYNEIIKKLKDPDLSEEEFLKLIQESKDLKI